MDHHVTIPVLSPLWWKGIFWGVLGIILVLYVAKKLSPKNEERLRYSLAGSIILREIVWHIHLTQIGHWDIGESLPFHLCGISRIASAWLLLQPKQLVYEYLALLGMTGAIMAFLTPELTHGMDPILLFDFYYAHAIIIATAWYGLLVLNMRMSLRSWLNIFILGHVVLSTVGLINFLVGGNYIYLCQRPIADNPLVQGEWPYYLMSFQVFALLFIVIFWLLFYYIGKIIDKKRMPEVA